MLVLQNTKQHVCAALVFCFLNYDVSLDLPSILGFLPSPPAQKTSASHRPVHPCSVQTRLLVKTGLHQDWNYLYRRGLGDLY